MATSILVGQATNIIEAESFTFFREAVTASWGNATSYKYIENASTWTVFSEVAPETIITYEVGKGSGEETTFLSEQATVDAFNPSKRMDFTSSHAAAHEDGGVDEMEVADMATTTTDTTLVLKPDGAGGVVWQTASTAEGLPDAIQTILKDLDGYGSAQTEAEHHQQNSQAIQTILGSLDGYSDQQDLSGLEGAVQTILKGLDGYGSAQTEAEHHQQNSQAIQTIIGSLDGYSDQQDLSGLEGAVQTILKDMDGYQSQIDGLDQTVSEHYSQHSQAIQTILKDADGYALATDLTGLNQTESEHHQQLSEAVLQLRAAADGYATSSGVSETTFLENKNSTAQAIQTILKDMDGYGSAQTESEHHVQHSQALQDIIATLDGYATSGGVSETTFLQNKDSTGEAIQTILKDMDGYQSQLDGQNQTESEHHQQHSLAIQTILKDLDGYSGGGGGGGGSQSADNANAIQTILKDLNDGYVQIPADGYIRAVRSIVIPMGGGGFTDNTPETPAYGFSETFYFVPRLDGVITGGGFQTFWSTTITIPADYDTDAFLRITALAESTGPVFVGEYVVVGGRTEVRGVTTAWSTSDGSVAVPTPGTGIMFTLRESAFPNANVRVGDIVNYRIGRNANNAGDTNGGHLALISAELFYIAKLPLQEF